jgi:tryptophan-rich sensory protein
MHTYFYELFIVILICVILLFIENSMLQNAKNNQIYKGLIRPKLSFSADVLEILWVVMLVLKVTSWYRVKTSDTKENNIIDFLLFFSLTLGLLYIYVTTVFVDIQLGVLISIFSFLFSLYYLFYVRKIDNLSGILASILTLWSLYLVYLNVQTLYLNSL